MRIVVLIAIALLVGCDAGELPKPPTPRTPTAWGPSAIDLAHRQLEWFPSDSNDPFPLDIAIRTNRIGEVRRLLESGANPNRRWGQSGDHFPLQEVLNTNGGYTISNSAEMVRVLLVHGADPNARWCPFESRRNSYTRYGCVSARGAVALTYAAAAGRSDVVELLLAAGADPAVRDWNDISALDVASDEIAFELISRSLFPQVETRDQNALKSLKSRRGPDGSLVFAAMYHLGWYAIPPPPPSPPNKNGFNQIGNPAHFEDRRVGRLRTLIRLGVSANDAVARDKELVTPLGEALHLGYLRSAFVLLSSGADPNGRECRPTAFAGYTPIFEPSCGRHNGLTPLMSAAKTGKRDALQLLLEFKADRSLKDWAGRTALDYATDPEVRKLLLQGP